MKAAPITKKPSFPLMKQGDIQNIYHLQMPRWLFTDPRYIGLSLEAKVQSIPDDTPYCKKQYHEARSVRLHIFRAGPGTGRSHTQ